jgi:hypothetical protein
MRMKRRGVLVVAVVAWSILLPAGEAGVARAQEPPPAPPEAPLGQPLPEHMDPLPEEPEQREIPPTQGPVVEPLRALPGDVWVPPSRYGATITAGGGVGAFARDAVSSRTGIGGTWDVRLSYGTRAAVAIEGAYLGGAYSVSGPDVGSDEAFLLRSALEGALRFNAPIMRGWTLLEPFALVGVGWARYILVNGDDVVGPLAAGDNQVIMPVGAGIAYGLRWFTADMRFTYRFAFDDQMFGDADMSTWTASLGVGIEF